LKNTSLKFDDAPPPRPFDETVVVVAGDADAGRRRDLVRCHGREVAERRRDRAVELPARRQEVADQVRRLLGGEPFDQQIAG
jgi:hypothetical protein